MPKRFIINFVSFQLLWLACVQGENWLALSALAVFLMVHKALVLQHSSEWWHALAFCALGCGIETANASLQLIHFSQAIALPIANNTLYFAPFWLVCLWVGFSTTFYHSLSWLESKPIVQGVLVALSIPFTYSTGAYFSGSSFASPLWLSLSGITLVWLCVLPFGFWLRRVLADAGKRGAREYA